jgi:predicted transcriptional regulator of viral defense system
MHLKYNSEQAGISKTERHIIDTLTRLGKLIIRPIDLEKKLGYGRKQSNLILSRLCRKGWLQRLKAGVYRIVPIGSESASLIPEDAWAIAMELFSPCYISGWTAAEHWELTEQIFNSTVVLTGHKQRKKEITIAGLVYRTKFRLSRNCREID